MVKKKESKVFMKINRFGKSEIIYIEGLKKREQE